MDIKIFIKTCLNSFKTLNTKIYIFTNFYISTNISKFNKIQRLCYWEKNNFEIVLIRPTFNKNMVSVSNPEAIFKCSDVKDSVINLLGVLRKLSNI